jgi:helix-turn-helix protein
VINLQVDAEPAAGSFAYSPVAAGRVLGVGRSLVYELIGRGDLDARKIGNRTVITADSIRRLLTAAPRASVRGKLRE